jgi:hypothetical protein
MIVHLVLLGDSILDNGAYVQRGHPAVIDQVRARLASDWKATLLARDGSVITDVHRQLAAVPSDTSHLMLSAGGNDALREIDILSKPAGNVGAALRLLSVVRDRFEADYRRLLQAIETRGLPTVIGTIYNPCFPDPILQRMLEAALCLFNDSIIRMAQALRFPVIDLRALCTSPADYANEIEPSESGGEKIARAICRVVIEHDWEGGQTVLFP